jgi:EmrB/QacA subfamily drug resistance transporter
MSKRNSWVILLVVALGTFMSGLDTSVVNVAMPVIQTDFGISMAMIEWIVIAYLLVISSLLLTFGRLGDLYGQRKFYAAGLIVFTAGSLLCGLSVNIAMLITCRVVQALGAGMIFSTGPAIITNAVPASSRGKALSVPAIAVAIGICIGPALGGLLTTTFGWRSIFYINVPVGILATVLALVSVPKDEKPTVVQFDFVGSVLIFFALLFILVPLTTANDYKLSTLVFWGLIAAGIVITVAFVLYERRCKYPMLNLDLFNNRVFAASNIALLFNFMAQFILIFLAPFYLENIRGFTPFNAGLLYMPMPLAAMAMAPFAGMISDRFDSRYISSIGMGIMAVGLFMMSFFGVDTSIVYIIIAMVIAGLGVGMFQTPNNSAILGNVPQKYRGTASGTMSTMKYIGMAIGIAVSGASFLFWFNQASANFASRGLGGTALQQSSFISALNITYILAAVVALAAMAASFAKGEVKTPAQQIDE